MRTQKKERSSPKSQNSDSQSGMSLQDLCSHPHAKHPPRRRSDCWYYPARLTPEASFSGNTAIQLYSDSEHACSFSSPHSTGPPASHWPTKAHSDSLSFPWYWSQSLPAQSGPHSSILIHLWHHLFYVTLFFIYYVNIYWSPTICQWPC